MEPQAARVAAVRALLVLLEQEVQVLVGREITVAAAPVQAIRLVAAAAGRGAPAPTPSLAPHLQEATAAPALQLP